MITLEPRAYTPRHLAEKILTSESALRGERKLVTVLFADVVRSMELAERVDFEEWHRLLARLGRARPARVPDPRAAAQARWGVVLGGDRGAEERHDAVTGVLVDGSLVAVNAGRARLGA
jgi:hypothetical protein